MAAGAIAGVGAGVGASVGAGVGAGAVKQKVQYPSASSEYPALQQQADPHLYMLECKQDVYFSLPAIGVSLWQTQSPQFPFSPGA